MKEHEAVKRALDGKGEGKRKTHTHGVHYERAGNGGFIAHVHKHFGEGPHSEGHSHTEEHVVPDTDAAQEHMEENMGDQPAVGEMAPQEEAEGGAPQPGGAGSPQAAGM